jgi:putative tricarboxylic transport membrane protein
MGLGLIGAKIFSRITLIPPSFLWSFVFVTCVVGAYSVDQSVTDVWIMLVSGLVGYIAQRHGFTPAPIVIGLILGPLAEESLSQTMIMFDNDWLMFLESPIVLAFLFITVAGVTSPFIARAYGATIRSSFARRQARKAAAGE